MKHPNPRIERLLQHLASPALGVIDLSLDRMHTLLNALGNPEGRLAPVVHVAGTNGKGSLLAYLAAILNAAGITAHRYISPHLVQFNERILLAGHEIEDDALETLLTRIAKECARYPVTFFEATTAAAFVAFSETPADIVLLETGLGGRLDATNVIEAPLLTAITPVSMDHMDYLGNTLSAIAGEKAGIIKENIPCVIGPQSEEALQIITQVAQTKNAPLMRFGAEWEVQAEPSGFHYSSGDYHASFPSPGLAGLHQVFNAATAIACIKHMKGFAISDEHIRQGITQAAWPARLQHLNNGALAGALPPGAELWLDGGHNPAAGEILARWIMVQEKPVHVICGMLKSKDALQFIAPFAPHIESFTGVPIENEPQAQSPEAIAAAAKAAGFEKAGFSLANNMKNAIESIVKKEKNSYIVLICGSLYLAGNILWQNNTKR